MEQLNEHTRKEDAASPTVMTNSVFMTWVVNTYTGRNVGACDLPGTFLHNVTDKKVVMLLSGELCELMVKVNLKLYRKYVMHDKKGVPVLYVKLYKSMYGLMHSALLFYWKLRMELLEYGFEMNPYNLCVGNLRAK